ncbi:hypothetical protein MHC_03280 [Mycoplasma haemocanis str. Illinois]|uniref:Uncharacterized protein n=1 Tax=Mycoplasma haemocanis (strain Illinois) TaxID=1111676 RepID=H6N794_MYCHN|nr:hypothetical protein [Mycoplasma haemocanis]AEW45516.1 hypothetical protein MHC_03280 [Mycoplasma haemocanis str. Illinois]
MNKLILASTGTVAASGLGIGSYVLFFKNSETISNKYKSALLGDSSNLWDKKWEKLKSSNSEIFHETLKRAKEKATSDPTVSKSLHKQGCKEIYSSPLKNSKYLKDLKNYCSKNVSDVVTEGNWINEDYNSSTKWDTSLKALKNNKQSKLPKYLEDLVGNLPNTGDTFQAQDRQLLKHWCDMAQNEIVTDDLQSLISNAKLYCLSNS